MYKINPVYSNENRNGGYQFRATCLEWIIILEFWS